MSLQVAVTMHVSEQAPRDSLRVRLDDDPTAAWFEVWPAVHGHGSDSVPSYYARSCAAAECLRQRHDRNGVVAVGRAIADDGWAGVFGMATLPQARGKGTP
jgi:hypothetical protein